MTPEDAFINSSESITGPITKKISKQGILQVVVVVVVVIVVTFCYCY